MLLSMVVVPKLCRDEDVFTLHKAFANYSLDAFSIFFFVLVVVCSIEEPVDCFDSILGGVGCSLLEYLPQTEPYERHLMPRAELDRNLG